MRSEATDAEVALWKRLRFRQVRNAKFRRQRPIGRYIVDFVCLEAKLVIEVDGSQHADQMVYDQKRTVFLESLGYHVLRFWNADVLAKPDEVMEQIFTAIEDRLPKHHD